MKTALSDSADGARPGWDYAGVVGAMGAGAWAERIAAPGFLMAELPEGIGSPRPRACRSPGAPPGMP